ncbi:phospholipase A [Neptunicella sp. SCSIO 80796]|uniref:phospholipase A n=1 Tax=Neptunicella plasticusilytica TaxID=3117012 RepID=UPI003A4DC5B2
MMLRHSSLFIIAPLFLYTMLCQGAVQKSIFDSTPLAQDQLDSVFTVEDFQQRRFRQFEDNYLILDYLNGSKVDQHIDAKLSVAYLLTPPKIEEYKKNQGADWNLAFSATVEFDFYMGTRHSGPVIGRRYNPGIQYYYSMNRVEGWREYRLSVEHESNGQSTESLETLNRIAADIFNEYSDSSHFDMSKARELASETISMGNNFVSLGGVYRFNRKELPDNQCDQDFSCFDIHFKLRDNTLITDENSGNFRSIEATNQHLSHYQGTTISYFNRFRFGLTGKDYWALELSYTTGQINGGRPGSNSTFLANIYYDLSVGDVVIPLMLKCRTGYLHDLYNFAEKSSECTTGFHFIY